MRGALEKPVLGLDVTFALLRFLWNYDTENYSLEINRVQHAALILTLAYTGSRPGAVVESACSGIRGTNDALLYRDLDLRLVKSGDVTFLTLRITLRLLKGKRTEGTPYVALLLGDLLPWLTR